MADIQLIPLDHVTYYLLSIGYAGIHFHLGGGKYYGKVCYQKHNMLVTVGLEPQP